jgi:hypothetical protein
MDKTVYLKEFQGFLKVIFNTKKQVFINFFFLSLMFFPLVFAPVQRLGPRTTPSHRRHFILGTS